MALRGELIDLDGGPAALFVPAASADEFRSVPSRRGLELPGAEPGVPAADGGAGSSARGLGMTRYWRAPEGLRLDVAAFVKALEHATGAGRADRAPDPRPAARASSPIHTVPSATAGQVPPSASSPPTR